MAASRCLVLSALAALALALPGTCLPADDSEPTSITRTVEAIWRIQLVEFTYNSRDVFYSCNALQSKIAGILQAVGAHQRMAVELHCGDRFTNHAYGRVMLAVPAEATPENVAAATTYDTRDELVARLRGLSLPTANDIERFPAHWESVSLTRRRGLNLDASDCDLLLTLRNQVFPKMPVRVESERLHCALGASTRIRPHLQVVALMRAPAPDGYYSMQ